MHTDAHGLRHLACRSEPAYRSFFSSESTCLNPAGTSSLEPSAVEENPVSCTVISISDPPAPGCPPSCPRAGGACCCSCAAGCSCAGGCSCLGSCFFRPSPPNRPSLPPSA